MAELYHMWPFGRRPTSDKPDATRRRGDRFSANWISCSLGQVLDLSGFGIKVAAEFDVPPDIGQELPITLRYGQLPAKLSARVVRVRRIGIRWEVALDFLDVPPSVRAQLHTLSRQGGLFSPAGRSAVGTDVSST